MLRDNKSETPHYNLRETNSMKEKGKYKHSSMDEPLVISPTWIDDDNDNGNNNKPVRLCDTLCSWAFCRLIIYSMSLAFAYEQVNIVVPTLGAEYFNSNSDSACDSDANSKYSLYSGISASISGVLGFLFQGYIGKTSDLYGRKKIMIFSCCMAIITYGGTLTFFGESNYFYLYLIFTPLADFISGSFGGIPTALQASIADIIPDEHRSIGYSLIFGLAAFAIILSSIIAVIVEENYGIIGCIYVFDIIMFINLLYLIFIIKETLDDEKQLLNQKYYRKETTLARKSDAKKYYINDNNNKCCQSIVYYFKRLCEPLWPLLKIKDEPILFHLSLISIFLTLPEAGIDDIATSYMLDVLKKCTDSDATIFESIGSISASVTLVVTQLLFLPFLLKVLKISDFGAIFIGLTTVLCMSIAGIIIYFFKYDIIGYLFYVILGFTYINPPVINSALSKRLDEKEQGIGLGVLHAIKGITWGIAPTTFALLYDYFNNKGFLKTMPFIVGTVFIFCGYPVLICPLRNALNKFDQNKFEMSKRAKLEQFDNIGNNINIGNSGNNNHDNYNGNTIKTIDDFQDLDIAADPRLKKLSILYPQEYNE